MSRPTSTGPAIAPIEPDRLVEAKPRSASAKRRRRQREIRLTMVLLSCGIAGVAAARWWASRKAVDIQAVADEPGYLSIGRLFAHTGVRWNMNVAGSYSPGYGTLLTPVYWLGGSGSAIYRHVIWLNVALGALPLLLLYVLARRTTDLSPPVAAVAATVISLAPAVVAHSGLAWSENLVAAAFLALLLASLHLVRQPSPRAAVAVALLAPIAYAVHARLLPSAVVGLGVIAVVGIQRRLRMRWVLGTVAGSVLLIIGVRKLLELIDHKLYIRVISQDTVKLSKFTHVGRILVEAAGQSWYLLVTTAGLVGFGVLALIQAIRRDTDPSAPTPRRVPPTLDRSRALVIAAQCGVAVATSIVFMTGGGRADQLIYGRYNDAVIGPLVLLGIAALWWARASVRHVINVAIVLGAMVVTAAVLWAFRRHELGHGLFIPLNVFGLLPLIGASRGVHVVRPTLVGLALTGGVALIAVLRPRVLLLTAFTGAAVVGVVRIAPLVSPGPMIGARIANVEQVSELLPAKSTVLYSLGSGAPANRFYQYQLHLPYIRFEADSPAAPRKSTAVFAMATDGNMPTVGARLAYIDPYTGVGLWIPPGHLQDKLDRRGELLPVGFPAPLPVDATQARVMFAGKPHLADHGRRVAASVRVERDGRGSPWPVYQGATDPHGTVRLAMSVTDPQCGCAVATGRADFSKMVQPGHHRVNVTIDRFLDSPRRLHPGSYQIQAQLVQEGVEIFGRPASTSVELSS